MSLADVRAGAIVSTGTVGSGIATWLDTIPADHLGKIASMIGIILSVLTAVSMIRKGRREDAKRKEEARKAALEAKILEQQYEQLKKAPQ